ncbi:hypothetical protein [Flavobacterium sp.]|uniref:hypothetical protein n=1 Tax=Flavobacterium sp. TaxID=239 RepID=UPI0040348E2A
MNELKIRGGAYIDRSRASWPFVTLTLQDGILELNAGLLGKFVFLSGDITSIGTYSMTGFGKEGIRIYHNVKGYPEKIIFQSLKISANELIRTIRSAGFIDKDVTKNLNITQKEKEVRQLQA